MQNLTALASTIRSSATTIPTVNPFSLLLSTCGTLYLLMSVPTSTDINNWMRHGINMCEVLCWNTFKKTRQSWLTEFRNKRPFCRRYRTICFTSSLIRQLYHFDFATVFDRVLLQLVGTNIASSLFKYRVSCRHLIFMTEIFELLIKSCKKFDLLFMHIQCATARSLENVNFKV